MDMLFGDAVELKVPSKAEYVAVVRALVTDIARRLSMSTSAVQDVQVAASEACANVVIHAYSDPDRAPSDMTVRCMSSHGRMVIEVADSGRGFSVPIAFARDEEKDGGLGLLLINELMDQVSLDSAPDQGTIVRMVKNARPAREPRMRVRTPAGL